ncbi:MAG TPA: hypothetical protein VK966_11290 [Longimicrobiales bacterium]|nr:hypothetical protein [Longimicrobiales bacterium]
MSDEKRKFRRETRLLQNEASWLQKAMFALGKVDDVRDRLADLRDSAREPFTLQVDGSPVSGDALADALETRAKELLSTIRERRNRM